MKLKAIIEGLAILSNYYHAPDGYHIGADPDILYAYSTDKPVQEPDLTKLFLLGWFQPDAERHNTDGEFAIEDYDSEQGWAAFV